jgi:hypothetical protein
MIDRIHVKQDDGDPIQIVHFKFKPKWQLWHVICRFCHFPFCPVIVKVTLNKKAETDQYFPPENIFETYMNMARDRQKL